MATLSAGRDGSRGEPPGSLGSRSSADHGRCPGPGAAAPIGSAPARTRSTARASAPIPTTGSSTPASRRSTRSWAGRPAQIGQRRDPRRRLERPDHARPAARGGGPGRRLDRRLARPVAQLRPGRGRRPRRPARMARGHHPRNPRRGPGHRRRAAGRALGRPARAGPAAVAGWPPRTSPPGSPTGSAGWRRSPGARRRSSSCSSHRASQAGWRPPSPRRPASVSSSPGGRGSGSGATSSASGRRRWSPATGTARRGGGRPSGSSTPTAASATPASAATTSSATRPSNEAPDPAPAIDERTTTMRLLHLYRPHLPLELARARASEPFPTGPLILGGRPWDPGPVIDANPEARALGVRRGMPLGSAHRLVPEATFLDPDPDADRATVEAAFEALAAFSPGIAGSADPLDPAFGLFEVQVDGLEALWGPEPVLVGRLVEALGGPGGTEHPGRDRRDRFAATVAAVLGPAPGADPRRRPGDEADFLAPHPGRPPHPGPGRPRPAHPVRPAPDRRRRRARPVRARRPVRRGGCPDPRPGPRRGARAVPAAPGPGTPRPGAAHRTRGRGPRAAPLRPPPAGRRPDRPARRARSGGVAGPAPSRPRSGLRPAGTPAELDVEQRFPEPTAEAEAIERLLFARLERTPPPAAVARLVAGAGRHGAGGRSAAPVVHATGRPGARLDWQLARLALTFGEDRVRRVAITDPEAPLPETRWAWRSVVSGERGVPS